MGVALVRRALTATLLAGVALAATGAAPPEEQAMLDAFDRALTAMSYAAAGLCLFAIVWSGFVLMAEGGEERGGGRAKAAVVMAVVGLVLVLSAKGVAALLRSGVVPSRRAKENTELKLIFGKTKRPDAPAEPKSPPPLSYCFMLSHLDEDGPVRLDGVKIGVCEVMGLEIDEPKLGAFAGALNACDFPFQLLIRQHPPRLGGLRAKLEEAQPQDLPPQTRAASESLHRLLTDLETRDGILDRRFYAVCEFARIDELRGLLARAGLSIHPLKGRQLRMFFVSAALGGSPAKFDEDEQVEVEINRRDMRIGGGLVRSLHLGKWPRSLAPGFLQGLMGGRSADGPLHPPGADTGGAGRKDP